jgi:nicotinate-nucleotide adenylyltransferase
VAEVYNSYSDIDEVWIMPCGDGRGDKNLRTPGTHRLEMVELIKKDILDECVPIKVSDEEIKRGEYMPTYNLLVHLKELYPEDEFLFCIGADLVSGIKKWDQSEKLIDEFEFIVISRPGYVANPREVLKKQRQLETIIDGSSTKIRNRIQEHFENKFNLAINGLTTTSVIKYIKENNLYSVNSNSKSNLKECSNTNTQLQNNSA